MARLRLLDNCVYFGVVVDAFLHAAEVLGFRDRVDRVDHIEPDDATHVYVLFVTHILNPHQRFHPGPLPKRYISYNFEQLATEREWPDEFFEALAGAEEVWEYSPLNLHVLVERGVPPSKIRCVPFGYAPTMVLPPPPASRPPIDVVFLGALNPDRLLKFRSLLVHYASRRDRVFVTSNDCWGVDLATHYAASRVGVNVHYYRTGTVLEVHRILPMIANGLWVVTERSDDAFYDGLLDGLVTWLDPSSHSPSDALLLRTCETVLAVPAPRFDAEIERRQRLAAERLDYASFLRRADVPEAVADLLRD